MHPDILSPTDSVVLFFLVSVLGSASKIAAFLVSEK